MKMIIGKKVIMLGDVDITGLGEAFIKLGKEKDKIFEKFKVKERLLDDERGIETKELRNKMRVMLGIIDELTNEYGKEISENQLLPKIKENGISEEETDEILEKMRKEGLIFETRPGYIQKI